MRKLLFLVISIFSLIILFGCSTPEVKKEQQQPSPILERQKSQLSLGWINSEQPIPIGEIIFKDEYYVTLTPELRALLNNPSEYEQPNIKTYIYLGLDDKNNVKVLYKYELGFARRQPRVETLLLLLPLNDKKQTMLGVKTLNDFKRDLLITVVDGFNRITVEEIVKTQMK